MYRSPNNDVACLSKRTVPSPTPPPLPTMNIFIPLGIKKGVAQFVFLNPLVFDREIHIKQFVDTCSPHVQELRELSRFPFKGKPMVV